MTTDLGPFGELDIREQRRTEFDDFQKRNEEKRRKKLETTIEPVTPASNDPLEGFGLDNSDLFGIENTSPIAEADEQDENPFGAVGLANVLGDVREGDTSGIENPALRAVATPLVKAGQGALAALEWSGNVGQTAAKHVTYNAQRYIPGRQELEQVVLKKMQRGMTYSQAVNEAWEETHLELLTIPFFTTALTPNGSITLDAQDLIAAGFDPIELALTFGTGGLSTPARGILKGNVKQAVGQSVGVRAGKAAGRGAKKGLKFAGDPKAGWESWRAGTTAVHTEPSRVVAKIADHETLQAQAFPRGTQTLAEKIVTTPYAAGIAKRIIGAINPNAIARDLGGGNSGIRAMAVYERVAGIGANATEAAVQWADAVIPDATNRVKSMFRMAGGGQTGARRAFGVDSRGVVTNQNIKLTEFGRSAYRKAGLKTEEISFGDLLDRYKFSDNAGQAHRNSWFTGLDATQEELIRRHQRAHGEMLQQLVDEGLADTLNGAIALIGNPSDAYRWHHRVAHSGTMIDEAGEQVLLDYRGGSKTARANFQKTRTYELMIEGIEAGKQYVDPSEALEDWLASGYRMIAEKRALDVLKADSVLITSDDVLKRTNIALYEQVRNAEKAFKSARANVGRLKRVKAGRRAKKSPTKKYGVDQVETLTNAEVRTHNQLENAMMRLMSKLEGHLDKASSAKNDGARRRARVAADKVIGEMNQLSQEAHRLDVRVSDLVKRRASALGKLEGLDNEILGLTDDINQALHEETLALQVWRKAKKAKMQKMEQIRDAKVLDQALFGGKEGVDEPVVRLFNQGPFSNHIFKKDVGEVLQDRFGDRGSEILRKVETITGTARTLSTGTADLGWLSIQGSLLAATHPRIYAKAARKSLEAVLNPNARLKYVNENMAHIIDGIESGVDFGSSEFFVALERTGGLTRVGNYMERKFGEKQGMQKAIARWRDHAQPVGRLGTGFNTFLDVAKIELWKSLQVMRAGSDSIDDAVLRKQLASHVNNTLGTLNTRFLGVSPTQRQVEGAIILFSPRYTRSAFALIGQLMQGPGRPGTMQGLASREAARAIAGMVAAGTLAMWAFGKATGQEPGLDPRKPGWLTIDFAGQNVGIGGSTRALLDMTFKSVAAMSGMDGRDPSDLVDFNIWNANERRTNPLTQFWLNRTAPGVREVLLRETFNGEKLDSPFEFGVKGIAPKFAPFAAQNFIFHGPGEEPGLATVVPETLGLRARPLGAYEKLEIERNKLALDIYGRKWDSTPTQAGLDADEKRQLEATNPELKRLKELAQARTNPTLGRYFERIEDDRALFEEAIKTAYAEFLATGSINGRTFREKYDDAVRVAFNNRQRREQPGGEFADAIKHLEELDAERADLETIFDRTFEEYIAEVRENPLSRDAFGNPNFKQMRELEDAFKSRVGEELFSRIRNHYRGIDSEGNPLEISYDGEELAFQLRRDRDLLNEVGYWSIADDLIEDPDDYEVWRRFEGTDDPTIRENIKRSFPWIKRVEKQVDRKRKRIRRTRADVDRALIKWYGMTPGNPETKAQQRVITRQAQRGSAAG